MGKLSVIAKVLRVKHWLKNALVLLPLIFSGQLFDLRICVLALCGFIGFSLMASAIYLFNDILDKNEDALHPRKRVRPIVSGALPIKKAVALALLLAIASCILTACLAIRSGASVAFLVFYGAINVAYSIKLKHIPTVDVAILSSGFLVRILYGGAFCNIAVSAWLCLSVLALSFFFALGKRRGELSNFGPSSRPSLEKYSESFLNKNMYVFEAMGLTFYSLWLFDRLEDTLDEAVLPVALAILVIMAIISCLRYGMVIESGTSDGDPVEAVFSDKFLLFMIAFWSITIIVLLYFIA